MQHLLVRYFRALSSHFMLYSNKNGLHRSLVKAFTRSLTRIFEVAMLLGERVVVFGAH